jgi:hypothetical protein
MALPLSLCIVSCQKQIKGDVDGGSAIMNPGRKVVINFTADAIQWFRGNLAPFSTMPFIDAPGAEAQKLA